MRIALAQVNTHVGAIDANTEIVFDCARRAREHGADLVVFPELTLSGYPPEDLLLHRGMRQRVDEALKRIVDSDAGVSLLVGYPEYVDDEIYNSAALIAGGEIRAVYRKQVLPNYAVFDEKRYFESGTDSTVVDVNGISLGVTICEDAWEPQPCAGAKAAGAELLLVLNGSPFRLDKQTIREGVMRDRVEENGLPLVYVNMVGGQDELIFDGGSAVLNGDGELAFRAPSFESGLWCIDVERSDKEVRVAPADVSPIHAVEKNVYDGLVMGTHDYVEKNGFSGVILGLSGGVDSALTLAVAVDALGA